MTIDVLEIQLATEYSIKVMIPLGHVKAQVRAGGGTKLNT